MPEWIALRVEVPEAAAEAVTNFLFEAGAAGVVTEVREVSRRPPPAGRARLEASVAAGEQARVAAAVERYLASLAVLEPAFSPGRVEVIPLPPIDWTEEARRHHRPVAVGRRLLVAPPWDVPATTDREVLVIEPGMAFGTGQHATTRGCLHSIEEALQRDGIASALDVGTGSGLLALALARLGVPRVVALDVDPAVLPIARANLDHNGARGVALLGGRVDAVAARFDLVVANLLADALIAQAAALSAVVAQQGRLVVSGILDAQGAGVAAAYPEWHVIAARSIEGWRTLTLERAT
jgi:ribosomal protein L11 methyltransferase